MTLISFKNTSNFERLQQLGRLNEDSSRLDALQQAVGGGELKQTEALALATSFGLHADLKARFAQLGVAAYGERQGVNSSKPQLLAANSVFMTRLQQAGVRLKATAPEGAAPAASLQAIHTALSRHQDYLGTLTDPEWSELISTCKLLQRVEQDVSRLESRVDYLVTSLAANDSILKMHGSMRRYHIPRHEYLQHVRRNTLQPMMDPEEFGAIYRYSRDHDVNSLLRQYWGKDNIPGHIQGERRRELKPEMLDPRQRSSPVSNNVKRPYEPNNNITTGHFIYKLDQGLQHLKEIQGHEPQRLYRATMFSQKWIDDLIRSGDFKDQGFISTSKQPSKLNDFFNWEGTQHHADERATLFYFETRRAVDISHVSKFSNETENLIPRGQSFKAQFLGYRRDLCPELNIPEHENWAVFALTDDGHAIGEDALQNLRSKVLRH